MITLGTEVKVVRSTLIGKKLGPKAGSLGFVSDRLAVNLFQIWGCVCIGTDIPITFYRYGRSSRDRCETRTLRSVIPIGSDLAGVTTRAIQSYIEALFKRPEKTISYLNRACPSGNSLAMRHAAILIPNKSVPSYSSSSHLKKLAWLTSIYRNPTFCSYIRNTPLQKLAGLRYPITKVLELSIWGANPCRLLRGLRSESLQSLLMPTKMLVAMFNKRMVDKYHKALETYLVALANKKATWHPEGFIELWTFGGQERKIEERKEAVLKGIPSINLQAYRIKENLAKAQNLINTMASN